MAKESFRWQPEIISGMTTDAIVDKMKQLVPIFDLNSFVAKTGRYLTCEDLTDEEYYPEATVTEEDEDFIWMACEELWKRLIPDRPAVEHVAEQLDNIVEKMTKAEEKERWKDAFRQNCEALDLICRHTTQETPTGRRLRRDFFDKLREFTLYDFDSLLHDLIRNLMGQEEYEKAIDIAGIFGEGLADDVFLNYKADSLFALGRKEESKQLYQQIIGRNPDDPWYLLHAGDCYVTFGEKDFTKAENFYLKALSIAEKHRKQADGKDELRAACQRLIDLAHETRDYAEANRYLRLLDSLRENKKVGRNDPCPCGSGKKYKKCCGRDTGEPQPLPRDRRLMERDLLALQQQLKGKDFSSLDEMNRYIGQINKGGKLPAWVPETPLERAQSLVFEALEKEGKKRLELAEEALKLSPDCADAYVLLAEERAQNAEEAAALYDAGVKAAERALGPKVFEEEIGNFWGVVEARPYMRARAGLAQCLWTMGRHQEAINHFQELLKLNPNDNQGIRYPLAATLLETNQIDALQELLGRYDEPTADWLFTKTLVAYVKEGDGVEARKLLNEALSANPHVAPYLLGEKKLPTQLSEYVGLGDKDEAANYVFEFGNGWHQISGAVDWLASASGIRRGTWEMRKKTDIPEVFIKAFESKDRKGRPKKLNGNEPKE